VIVTLRGCAGSVLNLDVRHQLGPHVELEFFQFVIPPIEFRLVRREVPLQRWHAGNCELFDLQHPPSARHWSRDDHEFVNDLAHRSDVSTCGVLSQELAMETRGLAFECVLMVWQRESTCRPLRIIP
jgi:hypothetical protein